MKLILLNRGNKVKLSKCTQNITVSFPAEGVGKPKK